MLVRNVFYYYHIKIVVPDNAFLMTKLHYEAIFWCIVMISDLIVTKHYIPHNLLMPHYSVNRQKQPTKP